MTESQTSEQLIWYACYGSNMALPRFLCYLQGGRYPGNAKTYPGGRDKSPPQNRATGTINHPLYFAKEAHIWGGGGVCFIGNRESPDERTLVSLYLISVGQFEDLHAQECNREVPIPLNLDLLRRQGFQIAYPEKWYGRILYLGEKNGQPILSFTNTSDLSEYRAPAPNYLQSLIRGLREGHDLSNQEILEYLQNKKGIEGAISAAELEALIAKKPN